MFSPIIVLRLCSRLLARQPACLQTHYPCCQNQAAPDNKTALVVSAVLLICLAVRTRLELATPCVTGMYSNQTELPDQSCFLVLYLSKAGAKVRTFFELAKYFFRYMLYYCGKCLLYRNYCIKNIFLPTLTSALFFSPEGWR